MNVNSDDVDFLRNYDKDAYERPSVAVDLLILTIEEQTLKVVVVKRDEQPQKGLWSLPGVFVGIDEQLDDAARRGMQEETGMTDLYMEQLYTWGDVKRDPRMRVISVSYISLVNRKQIQLTVGNRVSDVTLIPVLDLLKAPDKMAFDHAQILQYGVNRIRNKVEYTDIAFNLLDDRFTLSQLQQVYEILLGKSLYKANFRKKVKDTIEETGDIQTGVANRPSKYYQLKTERGNLL